MFFFCVCVNEYESLTVFLSEMSKRGSSKRDGTSGSAVAQFDLDVSCRSRYDINE